MAPTDSRSIQRAEWHSALAIRYRDTATGLLDLDDPYSAAALIYESAKQCVNAVANYQGQNPASTRAKVQFLERFAQQQPGNLFNLIEGWDAALRLHIHADRGHLSDREFHRAWLSCQDFIEDMLTIHAANAEP